MTVTLLIDRKSPHSEYGLSDSGDAITCYSFLQPYLLPSSRINIGGLTRINKHISSVQFSCSVVFDSL